MTVKLTDSAANQLLKIKSDNLIPRIEIVAGGCNGFERRFSLDTKQDGDNVISYNGTDLLLIDAVSYSLLENSQIDFKVDVQGGNFVLDIPHSHSRCGCGDSFSL